MPRRGENIYKRKDGRWEGRYIKDIIGNKAKYGYVYAHTYQELKEKLHLVKSSIQKDIPPKDDILFYMVEVIVCTMNLSGTELLS